MQFEALMTWIRCMIKCTGKQVWNVSTIVSLIHLIYVQIYRNQTLIGWHRVTKLYVILISREIIWCLLSNKQLKYTNYSLSEEGVS